MVTGLRSTNEMGNATDHLGKLNLTKRATSLIGQGGAQGQEIGRAGGLLTGPDKDLNEDAAERTKKAGEAVAGQVGKQASGVGQAVGRQSAAAARGIARSAAAGANRTAGEVGRSAAIAQRAARGGAARKAGTAVRGGFVAAARRRAATRAAVKTSRKATRTGIASVRGGVATARGAAQAATWAARALTALISSLTSTPVLITLAAIAVVIGLIIALLTWLPGVQQMEQHTSDTIGAGQFPIVDDYPFKGEPDTKMNPESGYYFGNCTDFVWWRINRDAGVSAADILAGHPKYTWGDLTPMGGNGGQWGNTGNLPGWVDTRTPVPGDIISIHQGGVLSASAASPGHVGYIAAVDSGGGVTIENYGDGHYYLTKTTVSQIDGYIDNGWVVVKHNPAGRAGGASNGDPSGTAKEYAQETLNDPTQYQCLDNLWTGESGWNVAAENPSSGAYGIPQALPGSKMASAGSDWKTNPITQVNWGLTYIQGVYGSPCKAWDTWQSRSPHWY